MSNKALGGDSGFVSRLSIEDVSDLVPEEPSNLPEEGSPEDALGVALGSFWLELEI